ncbi:MAG: hypothetical protein ABI602_00085 [Candidatus Saccharibacteria bacterium]
MSQIDIKSPDEDVNFDSISEDTGNVPMSAEERSKPISDFITKKPEADEFVTSDDVEVTSPSAPELPESEGEVDAEPDFAGESEPETEPVVDAEPELETRKTVVETVAEDSAPLSAALPETVEPKPAARPRKHYGRLVAESLLAIAVVSLALWSWTLYSDRQNLQEQLATITKNPQALVEKQTKDLIARVGLLVQLPQGETPTVAAVNDAAQAKQQSAFFANASNGDKVLMYVKAGKAILYRPSTNKIILEAPLTFNNAASTAPVVKK